MKRSTTLLTPLATPPRTLPSKLRARSEKEGRPGDRAALSCVGQSGTLAEMMKFLPLLLLLAGCDRAEKPQPPTAAESARLDEAENMLDELASNEAERAQPDRRPAQ